MALLWVVSAGAQNDEIEPAQVLRVGILGHVGGQAGKLRRFLAGADHIQQLAKTEDVGLGCAWAFGSHITEGASQGLRSLDGRYQAGIADPHLSANKQDIGRFDVAMN